VRSDSATLPSWRRPALAVFGLLCGLGLLCGFCLTTTVVLGLAAYLVMFVSLHALWSDLSTQMRRVRVASTP
jgi:hypothetical protein